MRALAGSVFIWCLTIFSLFGQNKDLYTNVYVVPPTFLNPSSGEWQQPDPFADFAKPEPQKTAKEILIKAGVFFSEGCSAIYNPSTSQLIVRNTLDQMSLVEAYVDSLRTQGAKQIFLNFYEVKLDHESIKKTKSIGFDWLLLPSDKASDQTAGKGRTIDSYQSFLRELSRPPQSVSKTPSVTPHVAGVFTDPQFQIVRRTIEKEFPKLALFSPPSVMVRSGQPALVQVDDRRYGAIAVIGHDGFTIDLSVFLPEHGKALFESGDDLSTPYQITIWDGQTVALSATRKNGDTRTVFVKAQLMDPAGMPINKQGGHAASETTRTEASNDTKEVNEDISNDDVNRVNVADKLALRASQLFADGAITEAADMYDKALDTLPHMELTDERREAYKKQSLRAKAEMGEDAWLANLPKGSSYTVKQGETLYEITNRFGTSVAEIKKLNRFSSDAVEVGQLILLPPGHVKVAQPSDPAVALKSVIIRSIDFNDAPLTEALGFVHRVLLAETDADLFPSPGPNIVIKEAEKLDDIKITLRLSNVPASEALRYITSLAQCQYEVDGKTITISPLN